MKKKTIAEIIVLIIVAFLVSSIIEVFVFNRYSFRKDEKEIVFDLSESSDNIAIGETEKNRTVVITLPEAEYYDSLQLKYNAKNSSKYVVALQYENNFGRIESKVIQDRLYSQLKKCYTSLNAKVKRIEINYDSEMISSVSSVCLYRHFLYSYERHFMMFAVILLILLFIRIPKVFFLKLENLFLVTASLVGISMILTVGLNKDGWDEGVHFDRAYSYSFFNTIPWNDAVTADIPVGYNTVEERELVKNYYNNLYKKGNRRMEKKSLYVPYNMRGYLNQALFIFIARHLNFSFYKMYLFGKLGNLILYILCIYSSIRFAKRGKLAVTALGLLPTPLFLAASYTYDVSLIAPCMLAFVIWMNEMTEKDKKLRRSSMLLMVLLMIYGCSSKAVYIPILLLLLLLPDTKFSNKREMYVFKTGVLILFLMIMYTFISPVTSNTVAGNVSFGGDPRGGDTGTVRQFKSILASPLEYAKLLLSDIFSLERFGITGTDRGMMTSLQYLSFANIGIGSDKLNYLLIPVLILISVVSAKDEKRFVLTRFQKIFTAGIILMIICLIWSAMYLSFTEVGMNYIYGVQARYYIPIMLPLIYVVTNNRLKINIEYESIKNVVCGSVCFILLYSLWIVLYNNIFIV